MIDGIEELKNITDNIDSAVLRSNAILGRLFAVACIIAILVAVHVIRHW
jgi:hypothetical protein